MRHSLKNAIAVIIAILLIYSLSKNLFEYKSRLEFYDDYKSEHKTLKDENKKLKSNIKKTQDYYVVEQEIREKLNLLKENEIAIILPKITPVPTPTPKVEKKPYEQWIEVFLK